MYIVCNINLNLGARSSRGPGASSGPTMGSSLWVALGVMLVLLGVVVWAPLVVVWGRWTNKP